MRRANTTTILLGICFGYLGIDRFYKGNIALGIGKLAVLLYFVFLLYANNLATYYFKLAAPAIEYLTLIIAFVVVVWWLTDCIVHIKNTLSPNMQILDSTSSNDSAQDWVSLQTIKALYIIFASLQLIIHTITLSAPVVQLYAELAFAYSVVMFSIFLGELVASLYLAQKVRDYLIFWVFLMSVGIYFWGLLTRLELLSVLFIPLFIVFYAKLASYTKQRLFYIVLALEVLMTCCIGILPYLAYRYDLSFSRLSITILFSQIFMQFRCIVFIIAWGLTQYLESQHTRRARF